MGRELTGNKAGAAGVGGRSRFTLSKGHAAR